MDVADVKPEVKVEPEDEAPMEDDWREKEVKQEEDPLQIENARPKRRRKEPLEIRYLWLPLESEDEVDDKPKKKKAKRKEPPEATKKDDGVGGSNTRRRKRAPRKFGNCGFKKTKPWTKLNQLKKKAAEKEQEPVVVDLESELTEKEKREREMMEKKKFEQIEKKIAREMMSEEERKELRMKKYFAWQAKLASMTNEEKEAMLAKKRQRYRERKKKMTKEELAEYNRKQNEKQLKRVKSLTGEKKERHIEQQRRGCRAYLARWKARDPEGYKEYTHKSMAKHYTNLLNLQRRRVASETPEQREARLLKDRVNAQKRKWRKKMESEGIWSKEQIEKKLEEVAEEVRRQPRQPCKSVYQPRPQARKSHKRKGGSVLEKYGAFDNVNYAEDEAEKGTGRGRGRTRKERWETPREKGAFVEPTATQVALEKSADLEQRLPNVNYQWNTGVLQSPHIEPGTSHAEKSNFGHLNTQVQSPPIIPETMHAAKSKVNQLNTEVVQSPPIIQPETWHAAQRYEENKHIVRSPACLSPPHYHSPDPDYPIKEAAQEENFECGDDDDPDYSPASPGFDNSDESEEDNMEPTTGNNTSLPLKNEQFGTSSVAAETVQTHPVLPTPTSSSVHEQVPASSFRICEECGEVFGSEPLLKDHRHRRHNVLNSKLTCPECSLNFPSPQALWDHYSVHHVQSELHLEYQGSSEIGRLKARTQNLCNKDKSKDDSNTCQECGKSFVQRATLDDHIRRYHQGKGHYCPQCGSNQQSATKLWRHLKDRHGQKFLPPPPGSRICEYCSEIVIRGYNEHVQRKHPKHAGNVRKDQNSEFQLVTDPKTGEKRLKCPHCPSTCKNPQLAKRHIRNLHAELSDVIEKHVCPVCDKILPSKFRLVKHYNVHQFDNMIAKFEAKKLMKKSGRGAVCLLCKLQMPLMMAHVHAHFLSDHYKEFKESQVENVAVFQCSECSEKFTSKAARDKHIKEEHVGSGFACQYCGEIKTTQMTLKHHEKGHLEKIQLDNKGICWVCKEDFKKDEIRLAIHMKEKHPNDFWACENCEKIFQSEKEMLNHAKKCLVDDARKEEEGGFLAMKKLVNEKLRAIVVSPCPSSLVLCSNVKSMR